MKLLKQAIEIAKNNTNPIKEFLFGAIAIRNDGAKVKATNGNNIAPCPCVHAEHRLMRKSGYKSTIFVARVRKGDKAVVVARPCKYCMSIIENYQVEKCYYTINENSFGLIEFKNKKIFKERIFEILNEN